MDHETYMRIMPIPEDTPIGRLMQKEKKAGEAEGIEKGKAEGKAEGMAEGIKKVAMKMLKAGMEVRQIAEFTGLTSGEIEKMKKSLI